MKTRLILSLIAILLLLASPSTAASQAKNAQSFTSILFVGDVMGHSPQFQWAYNRDSDSYDYHDCFRYIVPYVERSTYSVANLEVTLAGKPYSGYPCFSSPDELFYAVRDAGFNLLSIANNHVLDHGPKGMIRTINTLGDMPYMGAYTDSASRAERYPYITSIDGMRVAFFCTTYGCNGFLPKAPQIVNFNDTVQILKDLESLKGQKVDLKIIYIHWGDEYVLKANKLQRELAQWFADHGFDAVIGGHPHVVEDAEWLVAHTGDSKTDGRRVPVIYSLGNYISNQRRVNCNGGIMARLDIDRRRKRVVGISYAPVYVHKGVLEGVKQFYVIPTIEYLNGNYDFTLPAEADKELRLHHELVTERLSNLPQMNW